MTKFADNPQYIQYERLLDELSRLMAEGKVILMRRMPFGMKWMRRGTNSVKKRQIA